jgi:large subunit ribosomal protein L20
MSRVKRGTISRRRHKKLLKLAKGYRGTRKNVVRLAKQAVMRAGQYAYRDRRNRKRDFRKLWNIRINAAARLNGITYSQLLAKLKKKNIELNRKILADLAAQEPEVFKKIVETVKQ